MTEFEKCLSSLRMARGVCLAGGLVIFSILGCLPIAGVIIGPLWSYWYASFLIVAVGIGCGLFFIGREIRKLEREGQEAFHNRVHGGGPAGRGLTLVDVMAALFMLSLILSGALMAFEYSRSVWVGHWLERASWDEGVISTSVDYTAAAESLLEDFSVSSAAKVTMTGVDARLADRICAWSSDGELSVWALKKLSDTGAGGLVPQKYHKEYSASVQQFCEKAAKVAFD